MSREQAIILMDEIKRLMSSLNKNCCRMTLKMLIKAKRKLAQIQKDLSEE